MKVTRVVASKNLNSGKYKKLSEQAKLLGQIRKDIWQRFGSINGVGVKHRQIRDAWIRSRNFAPLAAKAWKETLRDTLDDIKLYEEAAKEKVRKRINSRYKSKQEQKKYYRLLKGDQWTSDPFLSRMMRKFKKHGKTSVCNQIIVENGVYKQFTVKNGLTWLKIPSLERGKMLCIPLNTNLRLKGCLRIILKDKVAYIHHAIEQKNFKECGNEILGVDKAYTEAFADSKGRFYGNGFGEIMTKGTKERNAKGKARNKLYQIAKKKPHKAAKIYKFNLGKKELDRKSAKQRQELRGIAFEAVHRIVDHGKEVRAEDLSAQFSSNKRWKAYNRMMASWAKGSLKEALESVCKARGSCLRVVNAAYTSQMDSNTRHLEGRRVGDKFYHVNGEVSHADTNAAVNIEHRGDDTEITVFTPYREVKAILLNRLTARGGVSQEIGDRPSQDSSCTGEIHINGERNDQSKSNHQCTDFYT